MRIREPDPYNLVAGIGCVAAVLIVLWWGFLTWCVYYIFTHAEQIGNFLIKLFHGG